MSALWSRDSLLFATLAVLGAAWVVTHLATLIGVLRASGASLPLRLLALVPVATPIVALVVGVRWRAALWLGTAVGYVVVRWGVG